jgi:hypothetical protein
MKKPLFLGSCFNRFCHFLGDFGPFFDFVGLIIMSFRQLFVAGYLG